MTPPFLAAVLDTLLPGDDVLPSATRAGLDSAAYVAPHRPAFDAIAAQAGGLDDFLRADEGARAAALRAVEHTAPDAMRALLTAILSDYYEAPAVLTALGWRSKPPQPAGHAVPAMDGPTTERLDHVRRRGKLWRNA
jgi:hypothetical protein